MSNTELECSNINWFPSYDELPMEIVWHILRFLGYSDRQAAAATCSRWYAALAESEFKNHTCLRFSKVTLSDHHAPVCDFLKYQLEYKHFYLDEVTIGQTQEFVTHIGLSARTLTFDNVDLNDKQFYTMIGYLPLLNELTVARCSPLFMSGSFLDSLSNKNLISNLAGIKKLTLRDCQYITDAIFLRLTAHMTALEALTLSGCPIAFHNAIYLRFYAKDQETPSESVFTFEYLLRLLNKHQCSLRELDFSHTLIGGALVRLTNLQLHSLYLAGCRQLVAADIKSFMQCQPQLVRLDLSASNTLNNDCVECIVLGSPNLEELKLSSCLGITNAGALHLAKLKHLRLLDISSCDGITTEGITNGLARDENAVLQELDLSYLQICEECIKCVARNLTELRTLNLNHCMEAVTDDAVQCIIQNLRWLRELSVESCVRLTDVALTGINVSKLEAQRSERSSMDGFYPPLPLSLAERVSFAGGQRSFKISLRSKAEEEIVRDAKRKQAMFAAYETNLFDAADFVGYNIKSLRGLRRLNLRGCSTISDVSLKYGLQHMELRHLLLAHCQQITTLGIEPLVQNCPSIEELDLSDCYNISDKTIKVITTKLQRLHALHISGCSQLTNHSLDAILVNCKCLQTLSVYRCRSIYMDIEERLSNMSTLRNLNMDNVANIDNADFFRLKKRLDY